MRPRHRSHSQSRHPPRRPILCPQRRCRPSPDGHPDLEQRVLSLYRSSASDAGLDRGFDGIAEELSRARKIYERTRAFDEALFGTDYEA